jgi:hypothetical protein
MSSTPTQGRDHGEAQLNSEDAKIRARPARFERSLDRLLDLASDRDPSSRRSKLCAFRSAALLYGALRSWLWLIDGAGESLQGLGPMSAALTACFVLSLFPRTEAVSARVALPLLSIQLLQTLPLTHNHFFLELFAVAILSRVHARNAQDEELAMQALRWLFAIVLFHTGLQKILYGLYFQGEFLAFMIGQSERFASLFILLLDGAEIARLQSYNVWAEGAGPFRVQSVPLLLASNAVYLAEITLAPLLLVPRTRSWAAIAGIVLVLMIQLGAREIGFAFLFVIGLLLFFEEDWNRRGLPVFVLGGVIALGAALGWLPGQTFMETINP